MNRKFYICFVICALVGQVLMAQNVTVSPSSGQMFPGVATGNDSESGKVAGFKSTWKHNQLPLTITTSDLPELTAAGDVRDPACTLTDKTYNNSGTADQSKYLMLANGATQTFMVVSLPKGYRFTGYTIVLQPNLNGVKLTTSSSSPANKFQDTSTHATCFYEIKSKKAFDKTLSPFSTNSSVSLSNETTSILADSVYNAVAASGSDLVMNPGKDDDKEFTISRTSLTDNDMGNRLYFWVGYATSYYAFTIKSFELTFTAEGDFTADVSPLTTGEATNYVRSPFASSVTDFGAITSTTYGYTYNATNVADLVGYTHLYQENAVAKDDGYPSSDTGTITPMNIQSTSDNATKGYYAFGNNTYYVEPPVDILTASGQRQPIGFRIVGATFKALWANKTEETKQELANTLTIYMPYSNNSKSYLSRDLHFGKLQNSKYTYNTSAVYWQIDEYGNIYYVAETITDSETEEAVEVRKYLSCYGSGDTRMLTLSSAATGDNARWNLRIDSNGRLYYLSDGGNYYWLYTKTSTEGSGSHFRGFLIKGTSYSTPSGYSAVTSQKSGTKNITLPGFTPGQYTLKIYDKTGKDVLWEKTVSSASDVETFDFGGFNNDAVKFEISGLGEGEQALVGITLKMQALNPFINSLSIVCQESDENGQPSDQGRKLTQTFTADDFKVKGGAFNFYAPTDYNLPCTFTFADLYSNYGDNTYYDGTGEGNSRYTFVKSDYFDPINEDVNKGLYESAYDPDASYVNKVKSAYAGSKAFVFNNIADVLAGTASHVIENPFSVALYKAAGGDFVTTSLADGIKATRYLFTADETRYNIAPTWAWQHRSYAYYQMDLTLNKKGYDPVVEWKKVYNETFYGESSNKSDAMWGLKLKTTDAGTDGYGYLTVSQILDDVLNSTTAGVGVGTAGAPASKDQILYIDGSELLSIVENEIKDADTGEITKLTLEDLRTGLAKNLLVYLPYGTTTHTVNYAYKTISNTFNAGNNIEITDRQPFYAPYAISVDASNYVLYDRMVTEKYKDPVKKASIVMPFNFVVGEGGVYKDPDSGKDAFSLHTMQTTNCLKDNEEAVVDDNGRQLAYVFFPQIQAVSGQTEANKPYLLQVLEGSDDEKLSFRVRQKGGTIAASTGMDTDYLFEGETASGSSTVGTEDGSSKSYTFTAHGGYSGKEFKRDASKSFGCTYFYFANNKFVSSDQLLGNYSVKVYPFRGYYATTSSSGVKGITELGIIFDEGQGNDYVTGITQVKASADSNGSLLVRSGKGTITLTAKADQDVHVYSVSGVDMANVRLADGESQTVGVPAGIYVVNGVKLIVK